MYGREDGLRLDSRLVLNAGIGRLPDAPLAFGELTATGIAGEPEELLG